MLKKSHILFWLLLLSAAISECVIAATFWGNIDLLTYNFPWAQISAQHWLGLYRPQYAGTYQVNYPPLVPTLLWPFGQIINHFGLSITTGSGAHKAAAFLTIKLLGMLFQWLTAGFIYWKAHSRRLGLVLGTLVLLNPSIWFNASFWGQADALLIFFIVVSFYYLQQQRFGWASFWFALGCLTKLQFMYLAPLFGLYLLLKARWPQVLACVGGIIGLNLLGWLPFMLAMRQPLLPLKVFTSGVTQYTEIIANGFNFWAGALKARIWSKQLRNTDHITSWLTYNHLNTVILVLIIISSCIWFWCVAKKKVAALPLAYTGAIYSGLIFMFTMGQHERYQLSMLAFVILLLLSQTEKNDLVRPLLWYSSVTLMTFLNQAVFYLSVYLKISSLQGFALALRLGGIINTLLFLLLVGELIWHRPQEVDYAK